MSERERVEYWHAQRAKTLLQRLFQIFCMRPGRASAITPFAVSEIAHDDSPHSLQLACLLKLEQRAVNAMRTRAYLFENEDRVIQVQFPGRSHRICQVG